MGFWEHAVAGTTSSGRESAAADRGDVPTRHGALRHGEPLDSEPLRSDPLQSEVVPKMPERPLDEPRADLRPPPLLLVVSASDALPRHLERCLAGYRIAHRRSTVGTQPAVLRDRPAVVILDDRLPPRFGQELCGMVDAYPATHRGMLVLWHGHDELSLETLVSRSGASGFLLHSAAQRWANQLQALLRNRRTSSPPGRGSFIPSAALDAPGPWDRPRRGSWPGPPLQHRDAPGLERVLVVTGCAVGRAFAARLRQRVAAVGTLRYGDTALAALQGEDPPDLLIIGSSLARPAAARLLSQVFAMAPGYRYRTLVLRESRAAAQRAWGVPVVEPTTTYERLTELLWGDPGGLRTA